MNAHRLTYPAPTFAWFGNEPRHPWTEREVAAALAAGCWFTRDAEFETKEARKLALGTRED